MEVYQTSILKLTENLINNFFTRHFIKKSAKKCKHCGSDIIENALFDRNGCIYCNFYARLFSLILKISMNSFGLDKNKLHDFFSVDINLRALKNVLKGLAKYNFRRPFTTYFPFMVVWDITYKCNLRCKHCYSANNLVRNELDTLDAKNIISYFAKNGLLYIAFAGGEPLMRDDIFDLIKHCSDQGIYTSIATNGTLITKEVAKKLKDSGIWYVEISLDGNKDTHEWLRGKNTYQRTIEGIKNSVNEDLGTGIATTVTKRNLDEIDDIIKVTKDLGATRNVFFNFIPTGSAKDLDEDLEPRQLENFLENIYLMICNDYNAVSTAPQFARVGFSHCTSSHGSDPAVIAHFSHGKMLQDKLSERNLKLLEFIGGCGAGRLYCSLRPNGDIQPCVFLPKVLGNIKRDNFETIWKNHPILLKLRDRSKLKGSCGSCRYKYICGGCRAKSYSYFGDICASDPCCIYFKNNGQINKIKEK